MPQPPRQYGAPQFSPPGQTTAARPRPGPANAAEVHRQLDAYEADLKNEQKRLKALRTLVPRPPWQPGRRDTAPVTRGTSQGSGPRTSVPGIDKTVDKMSR